MHKLARSYRLAKDFVQFARENKAWWLLPLMVLLGLAGLVAWASSAAAPMLYTLF